MAARLALALAIWLAGPAAAAAQGPRDYAIEAFRAVLTVGADASLQVEERITVAFRGSHQGIFRTIPVRYARPGLDHWLRLDRVFVLDEARAPLRTEIAHPGGQVRIKAWVPGAVDATRTVIVSYRARRALLRLDDHDELYWNVTGHEWRAPILAVEATVELPPSVDLDAVRAVAYTGPQGSVRQDHELARADGGLRVVTTRPLRLREGLTVAVGWPTGHVRHPSRVQELGWFLFDQRWFALPLLVLGGCLLVWGRHGRDPLGGRSVRPEYEPPRDLRPGELGTLVDEAVHARDVVATVVDLAVRGQVRIARIPDDDDFTLTLERPWLGDPDVRPFEVVLLAQVFGGSATTRVRRLSELRRDSGAVIEPIRRQLYRDLVASRYFLASPDVVRTAWRLAGFGIAAVAFTLWMADVATLSPALAGVASGAVVMAFARAMPRKTPRGAAARLHALGFQEFLERAEQDRLRRLPPDTLHRWLPHAIALGVEEAWIAGFTSLDVTAPAWYASDRPFSVSTYPGELRRLGREAEAAWLSSARGGGGGTAGSDGSGFSGGTGGSGFSGGSAGGGFGGGGGGTF